MGLVFYKHEAIIKRSRRLAVVPTPPEEQKQEASTTPQGERKMHSEGQIATTPTIGSADDGTRSGAEMHYANTGTYVQNANHTSREGLCAP